MTIGKLLNPYMIAWIKSFILTLILVLFKHDITLWNGLNVEWGNSNFVNPPYSRKLKEDFIRKAYQEYLKNKLVVMLLPVSTSTKIFHEIIYPNCEIRFLKGRIKFEGINSFGESVCNKCGMFDSMVCIFRPKTYPIAS